jgi:hypothetical protein
VETGDKLVIDTEGMLHFVGEPSVTGSLSAKDAGEPKK